MSSVTAGLWLTAAASAAPAATAPVVTPVVAPAALTIDSLVARLSDGHGLWTNGSSPTIDLPATATTNDVLHAMFERVSFDQGPVKTFTVVEERQVTIPPDTAPYRAARLHTDQGDLVVLLRFESTTWWTRAYSR